MPKHIFQPHELQELDTALAQALRARAKATDLESFEAGYVAGCAVGRQQERLHWDLNLQGYIAQLTRFGKTMAERVPFTERIDAPRLLTNEDLDYVRGVAS